jgi:hypothetical protein
MTSDNKEETSDYSYSYETDNSVKKIIVEKTKKQAKKKAKKQLKSISFEGDQPQNCEFCKKEFATPTLLRKHHKGMTNCGLKAKLAKYTRNFEKLKKVCEAEIAEKEKLIVQLQNNSSQEPSTNALGLSHAWQEKLKAKLNNIAFPITHIDANAMKKYKLISNDPNEQFAMFFKNFIDYKPNSQVKNGVFITNARSEYGLVVKCNDKLFIDTQGLLMEMLKVYWDGENARIV